MLRYETAYQDKNTEAIPWLDFDYFYIIPPLKSSVKISLFKVSTDTSLLAYSKSLSFCG